MMTMVLSKRIPGRFTLSDAAVQVLYQAAGAAAALQPQDTLLDLYCGTGSIGLTLASKCKALVGYEVNGGCLR
jgi:23S rRNA (uracil1939-C5)-methyltransferase